MERRPQVSRIRPKVSEIPIVFTSRKSRVIPTNLNENLTLFFCFFSIYVYTVAQKRYISMVMGHFVPIFVLSMA